MTEQTPYQHLTPDVILDSVDRLGLQTSGHMLALNSYENRVYMIGVEEHPGVVVKFYRPNRWSEQQILEEHAFLQELEEEDIPVVAPWQDADGKTLWLYEGYMMAVFPKKSGHPLERDNDNHLEQVGRLLGRVHAYASRQPFEHRITLSPENHGWTARQTVIDSGFLPFELEQSYITTSGHLLEAVDRVWNQVNPKNQRIHGDFHPGNILYRDQQPWLVDFDDCVMGPKIQDIWMLLSGDSHQEAAQMRHIMRGYQHFSDFDSAELQLIACCRALRILHYAAWLSQRWEDPAFPAAFPWFDSPRFWSDHILQLREELASVTHGTG